MMKNAEDFVAFGQGNLEAWMKSSQILVTGMQEMVKQVAATTQSGVEEAMSAFRALSQVRSVKEAVEIQSSLARTSLDKAVSQTGNVAEATYRLAEQAMAPTASGHTLTPRSFTMLSPRPANGPILRNQDPQAHWPFGYR